MILSDRSFEHCQGMAKPSLCLLEVTAIFLQPRKTVQRRCQGSVLCVLPEDRVLHRQGLLQLLLRPVQVAASLLHTRKVVQRTASPGLAPTSPGLAPTAPAPRP